MTARTARRYNSGMRRLLALLAAAWLVLALAPGAVLADGPTPDPRCADWEQHGAPPGVDMRLVCTANQVIGAYTGRTDGSITAEPAFPYVVALLVTGVALTLVGVVAMRFVGGRAGRRLAPDAPDAWWVCAACQSVNADGRPQCYACHAARATPGGAETPALIHREG